MRIRPAVWLLAAAVSCGAAVASLQGQQATTRKVDDATLLKPADGDWVGYGRDYAETHHSPLKQIDQSNVSRLGLAWSVEVGSDGKLETTPLVFNGVLYGTSTWSQVYAIDLRTNKVKWQWDPALVRGGIEGDGTAPVLRAGESRRRALRRQGLRRPARRPAGGARCRDRQDRCGPCRRRRRIRITRSPARRAS